MLSLCLSAEDFPRPGDEACGRAAACESVAKDALRRAFAVYDEMESSRLTCDAYTYASLIAGCVNAGEPERALTPEPHVVIVTGGAFGTGAPRGCPRRPRFALASRHHHSRAPPNGSSGPTNRAS